MEKNGGPASAPPPVRGTITGRNKSGYQIDGEYWLNESKFAKFIDPAAKKGDRVEIQVDPKNPKFIMDLRRISGDEPNPEPKNRGSASPDPAPAPRPNGHEDRAAWDREKNSYILYESSVNQAIALVGQKITLGQIGQDADLLAHVLREAELVASFVRARATGNPAARPANESEKAALEGGTRITQQTLSRLLEAAQKLKRSQKTLNLDALERYGVDDVSQLTESDAQDYYKFLSAQPPRS
jgi:hypothetical protein